MPEGNIVMKNVTKSTTSGVAAAIAVVIAKTLMSHGWVPADAEPYLIVAVTGALVGIHDFLRHSLTVQKAIKKVTKK